MDKQSNRAAPQESRVKNKDLYTEVWHLCLLVKAFKTKYRQSYTFAFPQYLLKEVQDLKFFFFFS